MIFWRRWWFEDIPPHIYALLRIAFGVLGCLTLFGVRDLAAFWDLGGIVTVQDRGLGLKAFVLAHGLGQTAGRILFFASFGAFAMMTAGFKTGLAVPLALIASLMDLSWNYLPHSGAYVAVQAILFCMIWADCGSVWSVDAWLERRQGQTSDAPWYPIAPLRLVRFQVGLIYFSTGLRKLYSEHWRDGSAIHYVLNNNLYRRLPHDLAASFDPIAAALTYIVLLWELGFLFALVYAPTRRLVLWLGVLIHAGMMATIEIGPFSWVMLASYLAFLDPAHVPSLPARIVERLKLVPHRSQDAIDVDG